MKVLTMYQEDPMGFFETFFPNVKFFENFQLRALDYLAKRNKRINTKSLIVMTAARGVGKSQLIAMISIWAMCCFETPIIRLTSSKMTQTRDVLFNGIKLLLKKSLLANVYSSTGLSITLKDVEGKPDRFQSITCQVVNERNPSGTGGDHGDFQVLCIDEAQFMKMEQYMGMTGIVTTGKCIIVVSGNPICKDSVLYDLSHCEPGDVEIEDALIMQVSGYDIERPGYNLDATIKHYGGKNSMFYKMNVLGEWLDLDAGKLFGIESIDRCLGEPFLDYPLDHNCVIGVDVAFNKGADHTCAVARRDGEAVVLLYSNTISDDELVDKLIDYCSEGAILAIDCIGPGNHLMARLNPHIRGIRRVNPGAPPKRPDLFENKKAEMLHDLKSAMEGWDFKIKAGDQARQLKRELLSIGYDFSEGLLSVTSKSNMSDSPDIADALSYTFIKPLKTSVARQGVSLSSIVQRMGG